MWVPRGSVNAYKGANGWKDFQNFKELTFGDVNLDGKVNKDDLNALVDFIMGENPEVKFAEEAEDAKIVMGGKRDKSKGYFVEPTVIETSNPHFKTMEEEIFGPACPSSR